MGFRDDVTALRARIEALEADVERLEAENARLRAGAVGDVQATLRFYLDVLEALRGALEARGERIRGRESYTYERTGYEGFYTHGEAGRVFVALHPRAIGHGLGPFLVQLLGADLAPMRDRLGPRWRVNDKKLVGWGEGPFVDLDLVRGLDRDGQVARLVEEIDAIRAAR